MSERRILRSIQRNRSQRGYALLYVLLLASIIAIGVAVVAPTVAFQIRRDREEELLHRGIQYSRAIRRYAKAMGRYPVSLDQLQNTSGTRFIRKVYKDPITGSDFRLLHQGDVASLTSPPALNQQNNENGDNGASSVSDPNAQQASPSTPPQISNSASGPNPAAGMNPGAGLSSASAVSTSGNSPFAQTANTNTFGGGAIFGVASKSKAKSIREFDHKNHYKDWLFFYDPARDRGIEIKGPTSLSALPSSSPQQNASPNQPPSEQDQH